MPTVNEIEAELLADAERAAGLADWGEDQSFRNGLRRYIEDWIEIAPAQADALRAMLVHLLGQKLQLIEDGKRNPGLMAEDVGSAG
jgi:hypothetical protein